MISAALIHAKTVAWVLVLLVIQHGFEGLLLCYCKLPVSSQL